MAAPQDSNHVLYPMQATLSRRDMLRLRGGLTLWLMSMAVPVLLLLEFRFVIAGGYVAPSVTQWPAIAATVVFIIGGLFTLAGSRGAKSSNRPAIVRNYTWALLFTLVAFILIGIPVCDGALDPVSHYGETFLSTMGTLDVYILFLWIGMLATRSRVKRLGSKIENYWGVYATNTVTWFIIVAWVITWIQLYYL